MKQIQISKNSLTTPIQIATPQAIEANHWFSDKENCFKLKANLLVEDVTQNELCNAKRPLIWIGQEYWTGNLKRRTPYDARDLVDLLTNIFRHEMEEQLGLNPHDVIQPTFEKKSDERISFYSVNSTP